MAKCKLNRTAKNDMRELVYEKLATVEGLPFQRIAEGLAFNVDGATVVVKTVVKNDILDIDALALEYAESQNAKAKAETKEEAEEFDPRKALGF